ncbi:Peroxin 6 [Heracleum sosnowskyi]|uniref:Peroxin 6 n=1 Tax=Heracleum sosnowskyi TaxID=360622 RepID=A0AAD8N2J8_9APIA|nr:Peroxin 6 [Heracleum sosnowskyi]
MFRRWIAFDFCATLWGYGVPEYRIERFLRFQPRAYMLDSERFKMIDRVVLEMGKQPGVLVASGFEFQMHFPLGFKRTTSFPANYSGKASKIDTVENNSTVNLFKNYGFTEPQITSLLSKRPAILSLNEDKVIRPRLDLFTSYGFSCADIYHILVSDIEILRRGIKTQIVPCCEFLKSVARDHESFVGIVKRSTWVLKHDYKYNLQPNIEVLRDYGVPEYRIERFLRFQPRALMLDSERFKMIVKEVLEMGFDPVKSHFLRALNTIVGLSKETRERKCDLYRKWGWTDDQILSAFRKQPGVLVASEEKIEQLFEFLIKKMGWSATEVWSCPIVIMHSFENWTVPRCFVVQFLLSKGALPKDLNLSRVIVPMENRFKERLVGLHWPRLLTWWLDSL